MHIKMRYSYNSKKNILKFYFELFPYNLLLKNFINHGFKKWKKNYIQEYKLLIYSLISYIVTYMVLGAGQGANQSGFISDKALGTCSVNLKRTRCNLESLTNHIIRNHRNAKIIHSDKNDFFFLLRKMFGQN